MGRKKEEKDYLLDKGLLQDASLIIEQSQQYAYRAINETLIKRNWLLGMRIQQEVLKFKRAEYGKRIIKNLSLSLVNKYGDGFQTANLYHFIAFYNTYPDIFYAASRKSGKADLNKIAELKLNLT
jgi:hypothetical protein